MMFANIIDYEKSKEFFDCSKKDVLQGFAIENSFCFEGVELAVDYFLGKSKNAVYDFVGYNKEYNNKKGFIVDGILLGGDEFGHLKGDKKIYLYFNTDTNFDEEKFECVAKDMKEFIEKVFKK